MVLLLSLVRRQWSKWPPSHWCRFTTQNYHSIPSKHRFAYISNKNNVSSSSSYSHYCTKGGACTWSCRQFMDSATSSHTQPPLNQNSRTASRSNSNYNSAVAINTTSPHHKHHLNVFRSQQYPSLQYNTPWRVCRAWMSSMPPLLKAQQADDPPPPATAPLSPLRQQHTPNTIYSYTLSNGDIVRCGNWFYQTPFEKGCAILSALEKDPYSGDYRDLCRKALTTFAISESRSGVEAVFRFMRNTRREVTPDEWGYWFMCMANAQDRDTLLDGLRSSTTTLTADTWATIFESFHLGCTPKETEDLTMQALQCAHHNVTPTVHDFLVLLDAAAKTQSQLAGEVILQHAETTLEDGIPIQLWEQLLLIYAGNKDLRAVDALIEHLHQDGVAPTHLMHAATILALGRLHELQAAKHVFSSCLSTSPSPPVFLFECMMDVFAMARRPDSIERLLMKVEMAGYTPTLDMFAKLCKGYASRADVLQIKSTIRRMESEYAMPCTEKIYRCLLLAHARQGDILRAEEVYELMVAKGFVIDAKTYHALVIAYTTNDRLVSAECVLKRMADNSVRPATSSFNVLIHALSRNHKMNAINHIIYIMKQARVSIDKVSLNTILKANCRNEDMDGAETLLSRMLEVGYPVDRTAWSSMLGGYARSFNFPMLVDIAQRAIQNRCVPTQYMLDSIAFYLNRAKSLELKERGKQTLQKIQYLVSCNSHLNPKRNVVSRLDGLYDRDSRHNSTHHHISTSAHSTQSYRGEYPATASPPIERGGGGNYKYMTNSNSTSNMNTTSSSNTWRHKQDRKKYIRKSRGSRKRQPL